MTAPIALFCYARPWHTLRTVRALQANRRAASSDLYVFCDGARSPADGENVNLVRAFAKSITGFHSVQVIEREQNFGLAKNITNGVSRVVQEHGRVIVVEDDLVTSPFFLDYMNDALDTYAGDEQVASIHGYCYPIDGLPETFFLRGADCWGWATWDRAWKHFDPDGAALLSRLRGGKLVDRFDLDGTMPYSRMLEQQTQGKNDSWAVRWHASAFLAGMLTLYPGRSLVHNIGNDQSGTHSRATDVYDTTFPPDGVPVRRIEIMEDEAARSQFADYFRAIRRQRVTGIASRAKQAVKGWVPTRLHLAISEALGTRNRFEGPFADWEAAGKASRGYAAGEILEKVAAATAAVLSGAAAFERDSVLFQAPDYNWFLMAGLLRAAADGGGILRVLDFGGSLGSSYHQHKALLQGLRSISWNVVEQRQFVKRGRSDFQTDTLKFHESIDEACAESPPNAVILGSCLQYLDDPIGILEKLAATGARHLIITKTPMVKQKADIIAVQHVPAHIYAASYPVRIFSEARLKFALERDWTLLAEAATPNEEYRVKTQHFSFFDLLAKRSV